MNMSTYQVISPTTLKERLEASDRIPLIDVRDLDEFAAVHVEGALCVPISQLLRRASEWSPHEDITLICHSGQRAREAAGQLQAAGFRGLTVVDGGTKACIDAGAPLVRGKKTIPLQRQVVMVSGLFVLLGLLLSLFQSSLLLISWLAAAGMVFAGVTGFCPMAKALAAAPWNRTGSTSNAPGPSTCTTQGTC